MAAVLAYLHHGLLQQGTCDSLYSHLLAPYDSPVPKVMELGEEIKNAFAVNRSMQKVRGHSSGAKDG